MKASPLLNHKIHISSFLISYVFFSFFATALPSLGNISLVKEKYVEKYGQRASKRLNLWLEIMEKDFSGDTDSLLYEVNRHINQIPYFTDLEHWGKSDYWATPIEMLGTNGGDCEDYVIAKYFTLRTLGIPDSKLRMMFVTALRVNQAHMVLAYYPEPNAIPLILDNINPRILPANKRRDLLPIYSFNGEGLWLAKAQGRGSQLGNSRHKLWDDLTARIERDF